jgi:predicted transcriptional regulator
MMQQCGGVESTTVTLDQDVFRAVKIKAARTGRRDSKVIEESLRRGLDH